MFGAIEFYQKAQNAGVKPIIGSEVYIAPESRFEKSSHGIKDASFHLVLLAKDETGYKNLMKLISIGYLEGFYYRPRIDREVLAKYNDGLVGLSACLKGEIPHLILAGQIDQAKHIADQYRHILGKGNFYLEIQDNLISDQAKVNKEIIKISKELDIPLVATNDVHYITKADSNAHEALLAIQTQTTLDNPNRMRMQTDEFYFKSPEIMKRTLEKEAPDCIKNTVKVAEMCNLELDFTKAHLPHYKVPEGTSHDKYLEKLVKAGLAKRYQTIDSVVKERVEHELAIIKSSGYISYFLIAWDFVSFAKEKGIPVGPGRGSAAGSVVSYALGITDVDPLKYGLYFERFLNPARITMPDIDIDFCYERRNEVIDYVKNKYSKENVAQIITFGTMMAKGVVRDVARVMGLAYAEGDKIAKLIPNDLNITLEHALKVEPELANLYKQDPKITRLIDISRRLEGLTRHASTHAAGVVISEKPLKEYVPLFETGGQITTGFPMNSLEKIGLLKMDFLGLRTLTMINETVKIIKRTKGAEIEIEKVLLTDEKTFTLLAAAESIGLFQLESSGMRDLLKKLKPEKFEEIIALLALFRPGPIGSGMLDDFIKRKHKTTSIKYDHPLLEPILKDTYGIIVFQEQVMQIVSELAGFSLAEADTLRRAISKKTPEIMASARQDFLEGARKKGINDETANKLFNQIEFFAGYGFNKCVIGSTELTDAHTGEAVTVESLYKDNKRITTFSCDEKTFKIISRKIKDVVCNGIKKTHLVKTSTGKEISVTDNHPFLTVRGWRELKDLKVGDMIAAPRHIPVNGASRMEEYKIIALADLLSEGNLCHTSGLYFYNNSKREVDVFVENIEQFAETKARVYQRSGKYEVYAGTGKDTRFFKGQTAWNRKIFSKDEKRGSNFRKCGARLWIEELGLNDKKAPEKFVPACVYTLPLKQLALFIGVLWSGDGFIFSKNNTIPFYATSSKRMAFAVQHLLLRFNIVSKIKEKAFRYAYKNLRKEKLGYAIYLTGRDSIENFMAWICPYTIDRENQVGALEEHYRFIPENRESKDVVPQEIKLIIQKEKMRIKKPWREIEKESGVSVKELTGDIKAHKRGFRRKTIQRLAQYFDSGELAKYAASDIYWDTINSIEYIGMKNTYDIEMEEVHNFIANNIIVHNSHSTAYAMISYRTAYLKANFPVEFMTALLTSERDNTDKIAVYINEAMRMGIKILPPDVNESYANFTVVEGGVRFGLAAVKNVGQTAIDSIISSRTNLGKFKSLYDFTQRVDSRLVNRKVIESLIKCGAFDSLGLKRSQDFAILDKALDVAMGVQKDKMHGQFSFFDSFDMHEDFQKSFQEVPEIPEWPENQLLSNEKEMLGFYITRHPLARFERLLKNYSSASIDALGSLRDGMDVNIGGIITKAKITTTRKTGEKMAIVSFEDLTGTMGVLVFPRTFQQYANLIKADSMVFISGKLTLREEEPKLIANQVIPLEEVKKRLTKAVLIKLATTGLDDDALDSLKNALSRHRGKIPVTLFFQDPSGKRISISAGKKFAVSPDDFLIEEIEELCGSGSVRLET